MAYAFEPYHVWIVILVIFNQRISRILSGSSTSDHVQIIYSLVGDSTLLQCDRTKDVKESSWEHDGNVLYVNRAPINSKFPGKVALLSNYSLYIEDVSSIHEGSFECFHDSRTVSKCFLWIKGLCILTNQFTLKSTYHVLSDDSLHKYVICDTQM